MDMAAGEDRGRTFEVDFEQSGHAHVDAALDRSWSFRPAAVRPRRGLRRHPPAACAASSPISWAAARAAQARTTSVDGADAWTPSWSAASWPVARPRQGADRSRAGQCRWPGGRQPAHRWRPAAAIVVTEPSRVRNRVAWRNTSWPGRSPGLRSARAGRRGRAAVSTPGPPPAGSPRPAPRWRGPGIAVASATGSSPGRSDRRAGHVAGPDQRQGADARGDRGPVDLVVAISRSSPWRLVLPALTACVRAGRRPG